MGRLTFVVATTTTTIIDKDKSTGGNSRRRRVVGVEKNDILETSHAKEDYPHCGYTTFALDDHNVHVCTHTVATIPRGISNDDALSTAAAALVGVHCAIPKGVVTNVDGGGGGGGGDGRGKDNNNDNDNNNNDAIFYTGKAVVLGGNTYTCVIADGLATLGMNVTLVSTTTTTTTTLLGRDKMKNKQVRCMPPAIPSGNNRNNNNGTDGRSREDVGFAVVIGHFDSLIDTLSNERKGMQMIVKEDDDTNYSTGGGEQSSLLLQLLQSRHTCYKYVSTMTHSQQIIQNDGILFGPGNVNSYINQ